MSSPGLLLQLDGSTHRWFGDKKTCLMAIIDDATSEVWAEFFPSETTSACMKLLRQIIAEKGVFKTLYVDRAGIYGGPKVWNHLKHGTPFQGNLKSKVFRPMSQKDLHIRGFSTFYP